MSCFWVMGVAAVWGATETEMEIPPEWVERNPQIREMLEIPPEWVERYPLIQNILAMETPPELLHKDRTN